MVDRVGDEEGDPISAKHPPASFQMVLDGQQRIQSLLLALGGDGWGFKLLDRQWHEHLNGTKPRGPRGRPHWSIGCLCIDVPALNAEYARIRRATSIDYATNRKELAKALRPGDTVAGHPAGQAGAVNPRSSEHP